MLFVSIKKKLGRFEFLSMHTHFEITVQQYVLKPAVVAERLSAYVKFKQTLTRRPGFESSLGITISIAQKQKYSFSNQSEFTTQIRTRTRTTQQGRVNCRHHVTVPAVPTQEAIPEEGGLKNVLTYELYSKYQTATTKIVPLNCLQEIEVEN